MNIIDTLKNSYLIVPLVMLITLIFVFIDSKANSKSVQKKDYINMMLFTGLISTIIVFINSEQSSITPVSEGVIKGPAPF